MGKRSRKRVAEGTAAWQRHPRAPSATPPGASAPRRARQGEPVRATPTRQRGVRPKAEDRPPPLWAPFPLSELLTLAGIVLMIWGFLSGARTRDGNAKIAAGLAIASIGGLELAVREHVTGFRSHTTLLAGAVGDRRDRGGSALGVGLTRSGRC